MFPMGLCLPYSCECCSGLSPTLVQPPYYPTHLRLVPDSAPAQAISDLMKPFLKVDSDFGPRDPVRFVISVKIS